MSIRQSLLTLLAAGPRHGYQLRAEFEERTAGIWPLNIGQVYSTLDRLERDALVAGGEPDGEGRRAFEITAAGRDELRRAFLDPRDEEAPSRDGLMLRVLMALASDEVDVLDVIQAERAVRMEALQARRRAQRGGGREGDLAATLAFDALIARTESELRWLDICEERILAARRDSITTETSKEPQ